MNVLGLDIGGANIKLADPDGNTLSRAFPMWTRHSELAEELMTLTQSFAMPDLIGLTMTGELADCFLNREDGVSQIIGSVEQAFPSTVIRVWMSSGEFTEPETARQLTDLVAAANWLAQATWTARAFPNGPAILVDMGSTTTDVIPLQGGVAVPSGRTDLQRLASGELIYAGASRTPLCAVLPAVTVEGSSIPTAAEFFATTADVFLLHGLIPEDAANCNTADGRPLTVEHSQRRLAKMICCDSTDFSDDQLCTIASEFVASIRGQLHDSIVRVSQTVMSDDSDESLGLIISGSASQLLDHLLQDAPLTQPVTQINLSRTASPGIADCACAYAVACLAHDLCRDDLLPFSNLVR
ncbi:MAG TPA: H4MPT-linked C1 transfer pathway protein [Planctomycetaceae bacterium]|nr:H4MPT-linked C1 transfer pathway protein [Planctomycetaceae bacterium]